jgi:hypothetical protein
MNRIKYALIGLGAINLFFLLTGIILPKVISTNEYSLSCIIFSLSAIVFGLITIGFCIKLRSQKKPKRKKNSTITDKIIPEQKLELLFRKSLHTQLNEEEKQELDKIIRKENGRM